MKATHLIKLVAFIDRYAGYRNLAADVYFKPKFVIVLSCLPQNSISDGERIAKLRKHAGELLNDLPALRNIVNPDIPISLEVSPINITITLS